MRKSRRVPSCQRVTAASVGAVAATHKLSVVAAVATLLIGVSMPLVARADRDPETGRWGGDVSARNFAEYCRGDLPDHRRSRFLSALDAADRALASQDLKPAEEAFGIAFQAAYRGGGDSDLSVKCLGESAAHHWFKSRLEQSRQQSKIDSRGRIDESAELYVSAVDRGAQATISLVEQKKPRRAVDSIRRLEQILNQLDRERDFGAFMLKEEEALAQTCRDALGALRRTAAAEHRRALQAEAKSFGRPLTENELTLAASADKARNLATGLTGVDIAITPSRELIVLDMRVQESSDLLRTARTWNLEINPDRRTMPSAKRARTRGDELLARAEDSQASLRLRDALYQGAQRYYEFGGFENASSNAASARKAIQPALQAERDRQDAQLEEASAEFTDRAESARTAAEKMKKSASEQQQFKDEADAMEAELGF